MARSPQGKITDVGEKIGRAAKDIRGLRLTREAIEAMTPIEKSKRITKANLWPEPNYIELVRNGMRPAAAVVLKTIYDRISSKPALRWSLQNPEAQMAAIDGYVDMLLALEQAVGKCHTEKDVLSLASVAKRTIGVDLTERTMTGPQTAIYRTMCRSRNGDPFAIRSNEMANAIFFAPSMDPDLPEWKQGLIVRERRRGNGEYVIYSVNTNDLMGQGMRDDGQPKTGADAVEVLTHGGLRKNSQRYFPSVDEAWKAVEEQHVAIQAGIKPEVEKKERRKPEKSITRAGLERIERIGPPVRDGDVSATELMKEFGFRAIEFGEWVPDKERRMIVNMAWDAFCDLAEVLQVRHSDIGLGGLALGFGSRGMSSAAAHYEPDLHVFNLTRMNGAGSMAHEYGHALDHHIFERYHGLRVVNGKATFASSRSRSTPLPKPEQAVWAESIGGLFLKPIDAKLSNQRVLRSFPELKTEENLQRIANDPEYRLPVPSDWKSLTKTKTDYAREAGKSRKSDYYLSEREMYARAFESWVFDTLKKMGRQSDYLVNSVEENYWEPALMPFNPYPSGDERPVITGLIEDTVASGMVLQRIQAMNEGITQERERRHSRWLETKNDPASKVIPSRAVEAPVMPEPVPVASAPAPVVTEAIGEDPRIDTSKPVEVAAWHASSLDAAVFALRASGYKHAGDVLTDTDREAVTGYVENSIYDIREDAQITPDMKAQAGDVLQAMVLIERLGVPDDIRKNVMEAVVASGAGQGNADWMTTEHAENVIECANVLKMSAPPPPPKPPVTPPSVQKNKQAPVQQAFMF